MSDHIEALERLARMRANGTLTDAEFDTEKARLLARPQSAEPVPPAVSAADALESNEPARRGVGRWAWIIALVIGGGVLFLAWDRFGFGGHTALAGGQGLVDQVVGAPSQWTRNEEADPMTDEQIISANRQIQADNFMIDTTIACRPSSGAITYTFTTFSDDGKSAEAVSQYYNKFLGFSHSALVRVDGGQAKPIKTFGPRYNNQFVIEQTPEARKMGAILGNSTDDLPTGQALTVQLTLKQGEPVFEIDQTNAVVASVLGKCAQAAKAIEEQRQTEAARPREPQTQTFTITADFRINDSRNQAMSSLSQAGIGAENVAGLCTGDKLVVKNDAAEPVGLIAGIYESDDSTDIGSPSPGATTTVDALEKGEFIITSPQHESVRMRYRVSDCTN